MCVIYRFSWKLNLIKILATLLGMKDPVSIPLKNDRLIRALLRQPTDRPPIWIMRQAGRYLPEYRALRKKVPDFMTFCRTPALACEATLQPLARFPLDAAIIFSDILTIPEAMGMSLQFVSGEGPVFASPLRDAKAIASLQTEDVLARLDYVMAAIKLTVRELAAQVPLIGFSGSPWTLATYMIEGRGSKTFLKPRALLYQDPDLMHTLLAKLTQVIIDYLSAQVAAGAQVLMVFDSWGGLLSPLAYNDFSLRYCREIAQKVRRDHHGKTVPLILFSKGAGHALVSQAEAGYDALGLDWTVDIAAAKAAVGDRVALQGNLDPAVLLSTPTQVRAAAQHILDAFGDSPGHVFNLGHGIDKDTPIENVAALVDCLQHAS